MRLQIGGADESTFRSAATAALDAFGAWQRHQGVAEEEAERVCAEVNLALDWNWSYADGDLGWWRSEHVGEFLLEWCPRKLSVFGDDAESIPSSLASFVAFLADAGLLAAGSSPLGELQQVAAALASPFMAAMDDPSQFGMAKSLVAAARDDGVDISDAGQAEDWMAAFNARPEEERRRVIPDPAKVRSRPQLAPVALPADELVAASRAVAPVLAMFADLAAFVGAGRRLTQKGNLSLADARALVERLGTGDAVDERIGQRTFRTRSAAELPRLHHIFAWAKKAGVVRVAHGKVMATRWGLAMASDPAGCSDRCLDAILAAGPLSSQRLPDRWGAWPDVDALLDRLCIHLLIGPYVVQRPVPIDELAGLAADAVLAAFVFPSPRRRPRGAAGDDRRDRHHRRAGPGRRGRTVGGWTTTPSTRWVGADSGGSVSLTPAGVVAVRPAAGRGRLLHAGGRALSPARRRPNCWWAPTARWRRHAWSSAQKTGNSRSPNEAGGLVYSQRWGPDKAGSCCLVDHGRGGACSPVACSLTTIRASNSSGALEVITPKQSRFRRRGPLVRAWPVHAPAKHGRWSGAEIETAHAGMSADQGTGSSGLWKPDQELSAALVTSRRAADRLSSTRLGREVTRVHRFFGRRSCRPLSTGSRAGRSPPARPCCERAGGDVDRQLGVAVTQEDLRLVKTAISH